MIGKIKKVPLRDVWKNEARNFTTWLFDNLDVLSEELDMDLTGVEREKSVGSFSADILAEDGAGQKVLIENQLQKTDHDHLGKILTYVSNLEAKVAIWISSHPRPEHQTAIEWLNEAGMDVRFYLVRIEAYKIGKSEPAAKFTIITEPSEKTEIVGAEKKVLAERNKLMLEFWKLLLDKAKNVNSLHSNISPTTHHWVGAGSGMRGVTYNYVVTNKRGQVELYIDRGKESEEENKRIFDALVESKKDVESKIGCKILWERLDERRACRISKRFEYAGIQDKEKWDKLQDDMIRMMGNFEGVLKEYIKKLKI